MNRITKNELIEQIQNAPGSGSDFVVFKCNESDLSLDGIDKDRGSIQFKFGGPDFSGEIEENEKEIESLESECSNYEGQIAGLNEQIETLQKQLEKMIDEKSKGVVV